MFSRTSFSRLIALALLLAVSDGPFEGAIAYAAAPSAEGSGSGAGSGRSGSGASDAAAAERFVDQLLRKMTLEEKLGQMTQIALNGPADPVTPEEHAQRGEVGSFLFVKDPARVSQLQHAAVEGSRLHIPLIFGFDVIHGYRTIDPVPIGLAASWDPSQRRSGRRGWRRGRRRRRESTGHSRRCWTLRGIRDGAG